MELLTHNKIVYKYFGPYNTTYYMNGKFVSEVDSYRCSEYEVYFASKGFEVCVTNIFPKNMVLRSLPEIIQ